MADAGVTIDANNVASVTTPGSPDGPALVSAWTNLQNFLKNTVLGSQRVARSTPYSGNVYSDYRFDSGALKALRVGFGIQYRGKQVIGFRGADTIVDSTNPTKAIDDPRVDAYTVVWAKAYYLGTMTLGYPVKIAGRKVDLNLSVSNLFNYRGVQYIGTTMRPPNGNVLDPSRVATPSTYSIVAPRGFRLSLRYAFDGR